MFLSYLNFYLTDSNFTPSLRAWWKKQLNYSKEDFENGEAKRS